jgi:hypothetical protein
MVYGFIGYSLFASTTAEYVEHYPPNRAPEIIDVNPVDGAQYVSLSLSELRFRIQDADGDLMSYTVTTDPDIGSGSGNLKPFGVYTVPVSGLQELTKYTWDIQVTDGKDTTKQTFTFTTEPIAPVISHPNPPNNEQEVPLSQPSLTFTLNDYQGDTMSYTVQTAPPIGTGSNTGVHNGTYSIPIRGLTYGTAYHWYVNASDGTHDTHSVFYFSTGYPQVFNPYDYGFHYRKQLTINHTKITDNFTDFTFLFTTTDPDLHLKAQDDAGDILFMDGPGTASKLYHETETYESSTGSLTAWIRIPALSSVQDTVIYMYYGNPTCADISYPAKTWDASYRAVWHMNDATPSTVSDSTAYGYTGTKKAANEPQQTTGKIGTAQSFDGTDDYTQFTASVIGTGEKTVSAWVQLHPDANWQQILANSIGDGSDNEGLSFNVNNHGTWIGLDLGNGDSPGQYLTVYDCPVPDHTSWHYYTYVYDGTDLRGYIDGAVVKIADSSSGAEAAPSYQMRMGKSNDAPHPYPFSGQLDEVRISETARSLDWIQTEYLNQNDPASIIIIGPEETGP